jgi:hypothetical protein
MPTTKAKLLATCCCLLGTLALLGCNFGSPAAATISGRVTYKGAPVTGGTLRIHYLEKNSVMPVPFDATGHFSSSGLPPGEVKVVVDTESVKSAQPVMPGKDMKDATKAAQDVYGKLPTGAAGTYMKIPEKYADLARTPIEWTLRARSETKNIDLTD